MKYQYIYTVEDYTVCPYGEGQPILDYLGRVFSSVAPKVMSAGEREPVDWLIVKSGSLFNVTFSSMGDFEDMLEAALKECHPKISVVQKDSFGLAGAISYQSIEKSIERRIGKSGGLASWDNGLRFLNRMDLGNGVVCYHLDMREWAREKWGF